MPTPKCADRCFIVEQAIESTCASHGWLRTVMFQKFQFSIRDIFWATTVFAVMLSVLMLIVRNPWLKIVGVGLLVALGCALPPIFARLAEDGETAYTEP